MAYSRRLDSPRLPCGMRHVARGSWGAESSPGGAYPVRRARALCRLRFLSLFGTPLRGTVVRRRPWRTACGALLHGPARAGAARAAAVATVR